MNETKSFEKKVVEWPQTVVIYTDGASRGNPGPASIGIYVINSNGEEVYQRAETLGEQTNNFAEYMAVVRSMEIAQIHNVTKITFKSDSQLLVRQMTGIYKVKNANIKPLFQRCKELEEKFVDVQWIHVPRNENKQADSLANLALDDL
jgi:ribonuclease HI